ncbi:MAG TPA: phytanoyl-CoA dioxygenase family protein [Roseiflexaceae bacterium]|nr:phytanoyl-CoA dioxygenase family protein [Roseiflexaceae bacterium]
MITADKRFLFDNQGYLHLRAALTPDEVGELHGLVEANKGKDIATINEDPSYAANQINRPLSRMIDADVGFARLLDHPAAAPYLAEFLGEDYRHIDNDLYFTYPGFRGGSWHRGVQAHPTGHVVDGQFICPMVKVFYCLTDVGSHQGEFVVVPGSHKSRFEIDINRLDLPGQYIFNDVRAGDMIIFNEALLHNGRPNPSDKTRITLIVNFGRADAGPWPGYMPKEATLDAVSERQRRILTPGSPVWNEPVLS